jgi:predicted alpha-1,2-mannosidase
MKRQTIWGYALFAVLMLAACQPKERESATTDLTQYVDQRIGTGGHGHVFMGANVPYGFVQLGPTSIPQKWDWTSGYHISDTTCIGFSHTHLSGTGIGDLADVTLMPVVGEITPGRGTEEAPLSGQASYFQHKNERMYPGFYATHLDRYNVDVALTATARVGFHRYQYPVGKQQRVLLDLRNGTCWDRPTHCKITQKDSITLEGYRFSVGWANNQKLFFTMIFSAPVRSIQYMDEHLKAVKEETSVRYAMIDFDVAQKEQPLYVKVALSPVSSQNANKNMLAELPNWDFEATAQAAKGAWNNALQKIQITSKEKSVLRNFYTAMYHYMIAPSVYNDVDGSYRGSDDKVYQDNSFVNYTTFSLWDTYRAAQPLMTLINPSRVNDVVNTFLHIYEQQGKLPVWHLMGCETNCMIGNPGIIVVADAIMKGFKGFDHQRALKAMVNSAMLDVEGMDLLKKYGYIPSDLYNESVANCMEYAIADGAIARVAKKINDSKNYDYFLKRSHSYRTYFDPSTRFMRGRMSDGKFRSPFDPFEAKHRDCDYTEGNAWQYVWLVPHDVEGLINLFGSKKEMQQKLDSLFTVSSQLGDEASPDISGLIGQYAHGNEPSHHILYLYQWLDQPRKTAEKVRYVLTHLYTDAPDGLSGNEDVGQMSAWYILSSLGFYQVNPAGGDYIFGSPLVDQATIQLPEGKTFNIKTVNNSPENKYIERIEWNGKPYTEKGISYAKIMQGGELTFYMTK